MINEPEVTTENVILDVNGKPVHLTFIYIGTDITSCLIHGYSHFASKHDIARQRLPVSGVTIKHPNDLHDINYAMRKAVQRACLNIDPNHKEWDDGMGKIGAEIYRAFRILQKNCNKMPSPKALHVS